MKAISLHQPWASCVALGLKTIETRNHDRFRRLQGKRIAIHAAKKIDINILIDCVIKAIGKGKGEELASSTFADRGKIVCTAKVIDTGWASPGISVDFNKRAMCETAGKFLLFLDEIEPLKEPIPFRGRQGIFHVSDSLIAKLEEL
ncbi:MAG TPA: hypothetical protein VMW42_08545 [Desulfatiglandales bacterium]|nr:hypothetical protein [Desulfatiglandales bacterium]